MKTISILTDFRMNIGHLKVRIRFYFVTSTLVVDLLRPLQILSSIKAEEKDIYVKVSLLKIKSEFIISQ